MEEYRKSSFCIGTLSQYLEINPTTKHIHLNDEDEVAFVPMTAVQEKTNTVSYEMKPYEQVKKGYTVFQKGDMLWAKITPCMQNGKSCIADEMPTEIGFGSTEFHVLRASGNEVYMPFLWAILSSDDALKAAQATFNGSAGQQRVSDSFLKQFPAILPDYCTQVEMVKKLSNSLLEYKEKLSQADALLMGIGEYMLTMLNLQIPDYRQRLSNAVTLSSVKQNNTMNADYYHPERMSTLKMMSEEKELHATKLVNLVHFKRSIVSAENSTQKYIGLASVESNTGELLDIDELAGGQAFEFEVDDVLYGRLRPYLNKVFVAENSGICSTEFHVMRIIDDKLLPPYLSVILRSNLILSQTRHMMTGNTHPRIANTEVENLLIPLPSKDIQQKIADEAVRRRTLARQLKEEAENEWKHAKEQFEKEMLGHSAGAYLSKFDEKVVN